MLGIQPNVILVQHKTPQACIRIYRTYSASGKCNPSMAPHCNARGTRRMTTFSPSCPTTLATPTYCSCSHSSRLCSNLLASPQRGLPGPACAEERPPSLIPTAVTALHNPCSSYLAAPSAPALPARVLRGQEFCLLSCNCSPDRCCSNDGVHQRGAQHKSG